MLKLVKAFSLILCYTTCFYVESEELGAQKGEEAEIKTQVSQNFDEISGQNMESFNSGIAAVERLRKDRSKNIIIPESLVPLSETFDELSHQVETDENPDNIDIILLLDANGKTQTLALMYFLRELENALKTLANRDFPETNLKLFSVIDSFVGEGGGAIPAAICALGMMSMDEAIEIVRRIPSKILCPKSLYTCCGCCIGFRNFTKAAVSAYVDKPELIDEYNPEWVSLYYDAFKKGRTYNECFHKLYGSSSISDLKSSFETISFNKNSPSILGIVSESISTRDKEAKSRIKRLGVTEILSTAETLLTDVKYIKKESEKNKVASSIEKALGELKIILHKSSSEKATISSLRDHIVQRVDIPRNTIIISIMSDTCDEAVIIPTFNYNIRSYENGKKIINLNYKISIPKYLYSPKKKEIESYNKSVHDSVRSVFPENERNTNISRATEMFIEFLDKCNRRILEEF